MNPNDPNVGMMELVAERLGERLREDLVFVGGAVTGLLITDPGQPSIRPTEDVDLIMHAAVRTDYQRVKVGAGGTAPRRFCGIMVGQSNGMETMVQPEQRAQEVIDRLFAAADWHVCDMALRKPSRESSYGFAKHRLSIARQTEANPMRIQALCQEVLSSAFNGYTAVA